MSAFDLLHPGLQHHVVNSLGWKELRPFQEEVIPTILCGDHVLVVAPTAGGKTEAAMLPALSRMLSEDWGGLSVIYVCPIRALLNNLQLRLSRYASLVGRTCSVWHGDTSPTERARIGRERPDILLTTPESLEVMLVSRKSDANALFSDLRMVIVDELHAFAGDDRGWHLLSVLQRISRLAGRELQRVGLSATVGNPSNLLDWLMAGRGGAGTIICPPAAPAANASVQLDYVGSLKNAAIVISRLHRGEKRLVFVDSRSRAEELATQLRQLEVKTFVTHSSLSKDQRTQAEGAFASETNCVIVATSVLELGVDVGDLDRVIQLDAPSTVASFLQRMGRTGRRAGGQRNCLFLATHDFALLQAAGLLALWSSGYVEDVVPPAVPYHVFAQQFLTLVLQNRQFVRSDWPSWIGSVPAFKAMLGGEADAIIDHMLANDFLGEDGGHLHMGTRSETELGHRHYSELLSVITSQPLFQVVYGRQDVGFVHPMSFTGMSDGPVVLALGGRGWRIQHVDWDRKIAHVQPANESGRSRWVGSSVPLSNTLCNAVRNTLAAGEIDERWSRRARDRIIEMREEMAHYIGRGTVVQRRGPSCDWWTFAGLAINQTIMQILQPHFQSPIRADNFWLTLPGEKSDAELIEIIKQSRSDQTAPSWDVDSPAVDLLKFSDLLPKPILSDLIGHRLGDAHGAWTTLNLPLHFMNQIITDRRD